MLAIGGALLYVLPRLGSTLGGDVVIGTAFALAAMGSMAFYGLCSARVNRRHVGPMTPRILPVFAVGSIPLVLWAATAIIGGERVSWNVVGMLAALGVVVYVPGYLLQHRLILTAGASWSALLGLAVPPLVRVGSALLHLASVPVPTQFVGVLVTVVGMALVIRRRPASGEEVGVRRESTASGRPGETPAPRAADPRDGRSRRLPCPAADTMPGRESVPRDQGNVPPADGTACELDPGCARELFPASSQ